MGNFDTYITTHPADCDCLICYGIKQDIEIGIVLPDDGEQARYTREFYADLIDRRFDGVDKDSR